MTTKVTETKMFINFFRRHDSWCADYYEITENDFTGRIMYKGNAVYFELEVFYTDSKWKWFLIIPYSGDAEPRKEYIWREASEIEIVNEYETVIVDCEVKE